MSIHASLPVYLYCIQFLISYLNHFHFHLSSISYSMAFSSSKSASSSVSYLTPASDSQTLRLPWDVFLSFRGPDTRSKFVSHLYQRLDDHGIRTFRDNPELRTGEVISEALIKAIQGSKTYVVVFSENYAHSSWCLDELVEIYKCYQNMNRLVIGVYYNIDPSVVRHQTKSFEKAFEKHQTRFVDKVNKWRVTLAKVADFSGQTVSAQR